MRATYRLQLTPSFGFDAARALVPYLARLGISHLYLSPILRSRPGSEHGYDVVDPTRLDPELGTRADFDALVETAREAGLGLLVDIVPNHMAASPDNPWWADLLRHGPDSRYAHFFDIDWDAGIGAPAGKLLLPILGRPYGEVLESGELEVGVDEEGPFVRYYETRLPLSGTDGLDPERIEALNGEPGRPDSFTELDLLLSRQPYWLAYWQTAEEEINYRRFFNISGLAALRVEEPEVFEASHALIMELGAAIDGLRIDHIDGLRDPGAYLDRLVAAWRPTDRGSPIADRRTGPGRDTGEYADSAAGQDVEEAPSPASSDGGTAEPEAAIGDRRSAVRSRSEPWLLVEKILAPGESLPSEWPVSGTTGYELMTLVDRLFVRPAGLRRLGRLYGALVRSNRSFEEEAYRKKKQVMGLLFRAEVGSLQSALKELARQHRHSHDLPARQLGRALVEVTACLGVYRTYIRDFQVSGRDRARIEAAVAEARRRAPVDTPALDFLERVLLLDLPPRLDRSRAEEWLDFVMRWQQFTGPVAAKGVEDTAFYTYNRLLSLNEVGGDPDLGAASVAELHQALAERARTPATLNATATHDAKRGEDARARLHALTWWSDEWAEAVVRWRRLNRPHRRKLGDAFAPDADEELLIYQTLLGVWPVDTPAAESADAVRDRVEAYVWKASREARTHTSWRQPSEAYEEALTGFVGRILGSERFVEALHALARPLAGAAVGTAIARTVLKVAAPGVPDFYQGTELWELSLVDPDNRRPVDYDRRRRWLEALPEPGASDDDLAALLADWPDGRIKLAVTARALDARRRAPAAFHGEYLPLEVAADAAGRSSDVMLDASVCAFARRGGGDWAVAVAALGGRRPDPTAPTDPAPAGDVVLPPGAPGRWRDALTGRVLEAEPAGGAATLPLTVVLATLPAALLLPAD